MSLYSSRLLATFLDEYDADIQAVRRLIKRARPRSIADFGGGFGRLALRVGSPHIAWLIIDKSRNFLNVGMSAMSSKLGRIRFRRIDLSNPVDQRIGKFDLGLIMYNTLNEIEHLDSLIYSLSHLIKKNGIVAIKIIVHHDKYKKRSIAFSSSNGRFLKDEVSFIFTSTILGSHRQRAHLKCLHKGNHFSIGWQRWIHDPKHIDKLFQMAGFRLKHTCGKNEMRMYQKL
ncbi:MAG: hypothetical protein JJ901_09370 [Erythrobacter sp.]|uniref:hypothetical protein n=1 Tax=Erythrobacter sp. TaxID=1042 RepID=UPI001B0E7C63|nr:hypothetical protein [Erythrobacter sp.]MBO6768492.1 hypothetical protein [Erythrobacter sp.]